MEPQNQSTFPQAAPCGPLFGLPFISRAAPRLDGAREQHGAPGQIRNATAADRDEGLNLGSDDARRDLSRDHMSLSWSWTLLWTSKFGRDSCPPATREGVPY